jgi:hypothetical protein
MFSRLKGRGIPALLLAVFFAVGLFAAGCDVGNDAWDEPIEPDEVEEAPER